MDLGWPEGNHRGTTQRATLLDPRLIRCKSTRELDVGASVDSVEKLARGEIQSASYEEARVMQERGEVRQLH